MSFVKNILTPIITVTVVMGFITWLGWVFYKFLSKYTKNLKYWLKYNIFRRKVNPQYKKIILLFIERNEDSNEVMKKLLKSGVPLKQVNEICYLFDKKVKKLTNKISNKLKGGAN